MEIDVNHEQQAVVVRPRGSIDTRSSFEFEAQLNEILQDGPKQVIIDCRDIDQLTSAGIRVLLLLAKRLRGDGGTLVLASPNDHVSTVLEISGLADMFPVVESATEAIGEIATEKQRPPSKISVVVLDLFGDSTDRPAGAEAGRTSSGESSPLSRHVAELLEQPSTDAAESPSGSDAGDPDESR